MNALASLLNRASKGTPLLVLIVLSVGVTPANAAGVHILSGTFGSEGSGSGQFKEPVGVAVDDASGDVYVVDRGNKRVEWFNSSGTKVEGELDGSVGPPTGAFVSPEFIAVDNSGSGLDPANGDVYVADTSDNVIDQFTASGTYVGQLTGTCAADGEVPPSCAGFTPFGVLSGVAVDPSGNVWVHEEPGVEALIDEFSDTGGFVKSINTRRSAKPSLAVDSADNVYLVPGGEPNVSKWDTTSETEVIEFSSAVSALAVNPATNNLFVDQANAIAEYGPFGEPYSEPLSKFPNEGLAESHGIAVTPAGTVYATQSKADSVEIFAEVAVPDVAITEPVGNFTIEPQTHTWNTTFKGTVNPAETGPATCVFEYGTSTSYGQTVPCSGLGESTTNPVPEGHSPVAVESVAATGLLPDTTYHYRLAATNGNGHINRGQGPEDLGEFTTPGPEFSSQSVSDVASTSATLEAAVDPRDQATASTSNTAPAPSRVAGQTPVCLWRPAKRSVRGRRR